MKLAIGTLKQRLTSPRMKRVAQASIGTIVGNALGAILPFVIVAWFGSGTSTDAYFYAFGTILFLNAIVANAVESSMTPHVVACRAHGIHAVRRFVGRTALQAAAVVIALTAVGFFVVVVVILPRTAFTDVQVHQVTHLLLLLSPLPALITTSSVLAGTDYAFRSFLLPTASQAIRFVVALVLGVLLRSSVGIDAVAWGLVLGELLRVALLCWKTWSLIDGQCVNTANTADTPAHFWRTATPQVVSMTLGGMSPLVDKTIAVGLGVGAVTVIELTQRMVFTPILLVTSGVGIVIGSSWSELFGSPSGLATLKADFRRVQRAVFAVSVALVATLVPAVWLAQPILRSTFHLSDPTVACTTFTLFAFAIPFALSSQMAVRALIAARRTRAMPVLTVATLILNLVFDILFSKWIGIPGIALSSTAVTIFNAVAYNALVRRLLSSIDSGEAPPGLRHAERVAT